MEKAPIITLIGLVFLVLAALFFPTFTPKIRDSHWKKLPNSIAELSTIPLGGVPQTIMIRGADKSSPVILFLHGGPGYPYISYAGKYQSSLEKSFVVVNWDQRGCGKSYSEKMAARIWRGRVEGQYRK